jgi:hypothetical protein
VQYGAGMKCNGRKAGIGCQMNETSSGEPAQPRVVWPNGLMKE